MLKFYVIFLLIFSEKKHRFSEKFINLLVRYKFSTRNGNYTLNWNCTYRSIDVRKNETYVMCNKLTSFKRMSDFLNIYKVIKFYIHNVRFMLH